MFEDFRSPDIDRRASGAELIDRGSASLGVANIRSW
jgi:hypothetical protein